MAPNRPQVVSFKTFTVRSGSALPSLHQNSQPMSQGTYSASSFRRSNTRRAASITSWPTPSPGIHAILYLAMVATLSAATNTARFKPKSSEGHNGDPGGTSAPSSDAKGQVAKLLNCEPRRTEGIG